MNILKDLPPYVFFTGKGGVGKTSISCASAVTLAESGKKVLLVSTDPASNVGQVFSQEIGNNIVNIAQVPNLSLLEIDPQAAAENYRQKIIDPIKGILPQSAIQSITEQLSGACTTEIAAFDEFTGLLTDKTLLNRFDHIIFDTAPTGHTIRLLSLPGAWSNFIDSNPEGASCLGPMSGLEKQQEQYAHAVEALADSSQTRLVLVARLQESTLQEVAKTKKELSNLGINNQYLIINGTLPESETHDKLALAIYQREQQALASIPEILKDMPLDVLFLQPMNMVGIAALKNLFSPAEKPLQPQIQLPASASYPTMGSLSSLVDELAVDQHGLIMLMGKGGVGKTTIASAIAVKLASMGFDVHLTTSDPAAHLDNTLNGKIGNLQVSSIDPQVETERYRQHILKTKGKALDEEGKKLLEEDLRSPCTEEIAVFQAFSRIIREADKRFVVMDTAPTGHTLLLLDATGAYHKEVEKKMKGNDNYVTPMMKLQDKAMTKVILTTLPETTPVLEAANLQADLNRANISPWAWVVNNALLTTSTTSTLLQMRADKETEQLDNINNRHSNKTVLVPIQLDEPVGIERLIQLAN
ncbi:MAG: arsenical pump-driving ATPase [Moritella sp.]|uniref:arsenical pump-driving ATPase n=1 Tax=Moritella sp. TaxID=78556 RepID=UPI0029B31678|nr:arsenical pump-driving ATPase [Moritella sp.]MDX2320068.1 arsenical pump-driving ATPase [Moritella sp.]